MKYFIAFLSLLWLNINPLQAQYQSIIKDTSQAGHWYREGLFLEKKGLFDSSSRFFEKAQLLYKKHHQWEKNIACQLKIARFLSGQGQSDLALSLSQIALKECIQYVGQLSPTQADIWHSMGLINYNKGDYELALTFYQQSLQLRLKLLGKEHPDVAKSYNNIGLIYQELGEYNQAFNYHQQALQLRLKLLGKEHPEVATSYNNVGNVYEDLGEYNQALSFHQQALQLKKKLYGKEHPAIAKSYINIGVVYEDLGEYNQALSYHQQALQLIMKLYGKEHPDVAKSYIRIGKVYEDLGEYNQALLFYEKAILIQKKILGKHHPNIAYTYNSIGSVYYKRKEYHSALSLYQQAIMANMPFWTAHCSDKHLSLPSLNQSFLNGNYLLSSLAGMAQVWSKWASLSDSLAYLQNAYQAYVKADTLVQRIHSKYSRENDQLELTTQSNQIYQQAQHICQQIYSLSQDTTYLNQSFYFSERGKATVLSSSISESKARRFTGIADTFLQRDQQIRKKLNLTHQRLAEEEDSVKRSQYQSNLFSFFNSKIAW